MNQEDDDVQAAERCIQWMLDKLPSCGRGEGLMRTTSLLNIEDVVIPPVYNWQFSMR
jgi:hypothetical protein